METTKELIVNQPDSKSEQLLVNTCGASCFLDDRISVKELVDLFPEGG
ncbi:MAG: hypothetical protein OXF88_17840 [Rhodobacteraceae bacterium]|nr:hypothetical protein [Paracoccaceae bacterium]MCY4137964.1 hypothetical protein [Paracoccaceae bacterium]